MENRVKPHSNVMMLELVITVAFFAIISIFLLRIFVAADESEESALMLSKATVIAESTFEYISADEPLDLTSVSEGDSKLLVAYYDKEWNEHFVNEEIADFRLTLSDGCKVYSTGGDPTYSTEKDASYFNSCFANYFTGLGVSIEVKDGLVTRIDVGS